MGVAIFCPCAQIGGCGRKEKLSVYGVGRVLAPAADGRSYCNRTAYRSSVKIGIPFTIAFADLSSWHGGGKHPPYIITDNFAFLCQTQIDQSTSAGGQWPPALFLGSSPIDIRLDHSRPMALTTAAQRGQSSGWPSAVPMEGWWFQQRGHLGSSSSSTLTVRPGNASPQKPSPSP